MLKTVMFKKKCLPHFSASDLLYFTILAISSALTCFTFFLLSCSFFVLCSCSLHFCPHLFASVIYYAAFYSCISMIMHSEVLTSDCNDQSHKTCHAEIYSFSLIFQLCKFIRKPKSFKIFMSVASIVKKNVSKQTWGFDCGHVANNSHAVPRSSPNTDPNQQS